MNKNKGFTLLETLIALSIFALLASVVVISSKTGIDTFTELEEKALAARALDNIVNQFRYKQKLVSFSQDTQGEYDFAMRRYRYVLALRKSQAENTFILEAKIYLPAQKQAIITRQEVY